VLDKKTYLPLLKSSSFEGTVPYMYEDTEGNVTVGVGFLLPSVVEAQKLGFARRPSLTSRPPVHAGPATPAEIKTDFENVDRQPYGKGYGAIYYKQFTKLDLPSDVINRILEAKVEQFLVQVVAQFPDYNSYPSEACAAIFDMAYNLGVGKLTSLFPSFCSAVNKQDWKTAAGQCHRLGIQESRNTWTKAQFEKAAAVAKARESQSVTGLNAKP
jgi:GH24 family phage-related lysozyme (muramidase)